VNEKRTGRPLRAGGGLGALIEVRVSLLEKRSSESEQDCDSVACADQPRISQADQDADILGQSWRFLSCSHPERLSDACQGIAHGTACRGGTQVKNLQAVQGISATGF
jgi:hypothetical protein